MVTRIVAYKYWLLYIFLAICFLLSIFFVQHNYAFYERPIAKVIEVSVEEATDVIDMHNNQDHVVVQSIVAEIKNGTEKGKFVALKNKYSLSKTYNQAYHVGDDVFIWIDSTTSNSSNLSGTILDLKRDQHLLFIAWVLFSFWF